jgi:hypothetical protein
MLIYPESNTINMKYFKLILLTIIMVSCKQIPDIRFLEPQPISKKNIKVIPKEYWGKYLSKIDSSILTIDSKMIVQEKFESSKISIIEMQQELDTTIQDDTQIELGTNWTMDIKIKNDSALVSSYIIDTIFQISESNILRSFKGYLFLNYKDIDSTWRVKTLKLENGQLDFGSLVNVNQIDTLKEVTRIVTSMDTSSNRVNHYDLNPKRKELKEILEQKDTASIYIKL